MGSTWKPKGPLDSVPAVPKGSAAAKGAQGVARRRARYFTVLGVQAFLAVILLAAAAFTWEDGFTARLYLWAAIIPIGFAGVFTWTYLRGERVRREGAWTLDWEKAEAKRAFRMLGAVGLVWALGLVGIALV